MTSTGPIPGGPSGVPGTRRVPWVAIAVSLAAVVALVVGVVVVVQQRGGGTQTPPPSTPTVSSATPTPTPTPDQTCLPEAKSGAKAKNWPCFPQQKKSQDARIAADHKSASDAIRLGAFEAENLYAAGASRPSAALRKYYTGEVLSDVSAALTIYSKSGSRVLGHGRYLKFKYSTAAPLPENGSTQIVVACADYTDLRFKEGSTGKMSPLYPDSRPRSTEIVVVRESGGWKVQSAKDDKVVNSCG